MEFAILIVGVVFALGTAAGFLVLVGYFVRHRIEDWRDARTAQRLSQEARKQRPHKHD